ncbi:MAG: hypothetical protein HKO81_08905 [Flavobacteriaceae bacterium]|nr:hypothetical protein [Flavobacteriaceae bacterium]
MKTLGKFKLVLGLSLVAIIGLITLNSFTRIDDNLNSIYINDSVNITIDSDTTDDELDDIKAMLKEHGITAKFSNIKRNSDGELTSIKIELKDENGNTAVSQTSSTDPIQTFSFGRKNNSLYVSQGKSHFGNFALFSDDMTFDFDFDHDSIFTHHFGKLDSLNFDHMFMFDDENNVFSFNGKSFDMDELKEKMNNMFIIEDEEDGKKRIIIKGHNGNHFFFDDEDHILEWHSDKDEDGNIKKHQKFRFVDNPDTEKLIVIDGKESDFKTLDDLAKNDKIESVDVLKSKTAMSIYGDKAKDGAIIATTK